MSGGSTAAPSPRAMTARDLDAVDALATRTFDDLGARLGLDGPGRGERSDADRARSRARTSHLLDHHGAGCWVVDAPEGGHLAAAGLALRRERFWGLSLLVVDPDHQGAGLGSAVLRATLTSAEGSDRRMIVSSPDAPALRVYARAGFALHPALRAVGPVDRRRIPAGADRGVRDAKPSDREWIDDLDRRRRGGPHADDFEPMLAHGGRLLVAERGRARGYAVQWRDGIGVLAADHVACARALAWRIVAESEPGSDTGVAYAAAAHQWLVAFALDAGLPLTVQGAICVAGIAPSATYVPSGAWL